MSQKLNMRQKVLVSNLVQELQDLFEKDDIDNISNQISIKELCHRLEQEDVINFNQAFDLEVYMIGLLNLIKAAK